MCVGAFLRQKMAVFVALLFVVFFPLVVTQSFGAEAPTHGILPGFQEDEGQIGQAKIQAKIAELPVSFIANAGQADMNVQFMVKAGKQTIFFTPKEVVFAVSEGTEDEDTRSSVVRLRFAGANGEVKVEGEKPLPGVANFFLGNDPEQWRTNVPTYAAITYHNLYPGIDLVYSGEQGRLKSEFVVAAGADPTVITMDYSGVSSMYVRENGALVLETSIGELIEAPPLIYQMIDEERVTVEGGYRLFGEGKVVFSLGDYVSTKPLIIDPTLVYSTYIGGSSTDESCGIALDASGCVYLTGVTNSTNFPTQNALQPDNGEGDSDAFVAKLSPSGSSLVYCTYLGGSDSDGGKGIAVDVLGNVYITGYTWSADFPTQNALQPGLGGDSDAFVAKLSPSGSSLVYSTYLGGSGAGYGHGNKDAGYDITVDSSGNVYVTGGTYSDDFPTQNPLQPDFGWGWYDAFVAKLSPSGSSLVYSTYLGGSGYDRGYGIEVDAFGNAYVTGFTSSSDFPTENALQPDYGGGDFDAFVANLNPSGSSLVYSTYLGGSSYDAGYDITVDSSGNVYVTGATHSTNFPTQNALQPDYAGGNLDAFITKLSTSGSSLVYSTYLGGSNDDRGYALAVDGSRDACVTGVTWSTNFPTENALQPDLGGQSDAFVAKLNPSSPSLVYSTYLGGSGTEYSQSIAVDALGNAYITGHTGSLDFPTQNPLQPDYGGEYDAFVAKIGEGAPTTIYVPDDYSTIQAAVDAASPGDTIIVRDGTYTENVDVNKDNLTIRSQNGAEGTIIQAANAGDHVFEIRADHAKISGFTVNGATAFSASGIYVANADSCDLRDNSISSNCASITLERSSGNAVINNKVFNNSASIRLSYSNDNTLNSNHIFSNEGACGLYLYESYRNSIQANLISQNVFGIDVDYSDSNHITSNEISNNWCGISLDAGANGNSFSNNNVINNRYAITSAEPANNNEIHCNNFINNTETSYDYYGTNIWKSPEQLTYTYNGYTYINYLGNYWDDYTGDDDDGDGIGDTPYAINSDNDNFPLMEPFENYVMLEDTGTVTGRVTDASTGEGIAGATVEAEEPPVPLSAKEQVSSPTQAGTPYSTTTDANGDYTLYLPEGSYGMTASAEGYELGMGGATITAGETTEVNFSLIPLAPENYPPIAYASDISGQPQTMHPDTVYSVTAKYYDPDGRTDLKHCYLQLNHPSKPLTMMWYQSDGHAAPWAGEEGENYLTITNVNVTEIANSSEGYELSWSFQINDSWPEVEDAIDFGVFASDDGDLESGWEYDDTNASFSVDTAPPQLIQDFTASDGEDRQCTLHWTNPPDSDLAEVVVRRKTSGYPTDHTDGFLRVRRTSPTPGGEGRYADTDVTNDTTYFYAVFTCDASGNWNRTWEEGKNADIGYPTRSLAVPYYNQDNTQWCWATSSAMLLKYYGFDVEPWEIAGVLDAGPDEMALDLRVHNYLEQHFDGALQDDWAFDWFEVGISDTKQAIISALSKGSPVYFGLKARDKPLTEGHVIVIVDWDGQDWDDEVSFHDPSNYLEMGEIFATVTWRELFDKISFTSLHVQLLYNLIFARPTAFSAEGKPLTVSVLPQLPDGSTPFVVSGLKEEMHFTWDGRWEHGYLYSYRWGERVEFPKDSQLGYAATPVSSLSLVASVANSAPYPITARLQLEISRVDASGNRMSVNTDPIVEDFRIERWSWSNQNTLDAKPLSQLAMLDPGTYILSLSVTDPVSHGLCDTTEILLRVATPTSSGLTVRVVSQDGNAILVFDRVLNGGNTNVVKLDISVDDLGGMVFPHKANPLNPSSRTETNTVNSGIPNANPMRQVLGGIRLLDRGYYVDTTASFTGDVTISIHYDDSGLTLSQEKNLKMYKVVDTPWWKWWDDRIDITQSVDTVANVITGRTDTLSTFLIGHEVGTVPEGKLINHGPNPVPAEGCIFWLDLPDDTVDATLKILDIDGALLVSILLDPTMDRYPAAGRWIPEDDQGRLLGTGLYLYLVEIEHTDGTITYSPVQKMVIQR